jgi:hypothetical protein
MPQSRRLEDRIRELCRLAASSPNHQVAPIISELDIALTEYIRRIDNKVSASVLNFPDVPIERRKAN